MTEIDGWTLSDLTVIQHEFFPIYVELVDRMLKEMKNDKQKTRDILTTETLAFIDCLLLNKPNESEWISKFSEWQHDYTPSMSDLVDNFLNDEDLSAENPPNKKLRVQKILHFHFPLMIRDLVGT